MIKDRADWEKLVDKSAEKFYEQAYKAVSQYHGSTYSHEAADVLAKAYAIMVKSKDMKEAESRIFTQEFLNNKIEVKQP
jgi:hypothetical protein